MAYRDQLPDAHGYDSHSPKPGQSVYVTDVTHAWLGVFVGYREGRALVQTPGGEVVAVDPRTLRR